MMSKIMLWYLKQPAYYPALFWVLFIKFKKLLKYSYYEKKSTSSKNWCDDLAQDRNTVLGSITGDSSKKTLVELHREEMILAQKTAEHCTIKMGGAGDLELIYKLAEYIEAKRVIETGVAYGWSSLALLLSLKNRPGAQLVSTDMPYPNLANDLYVGCVVPPNLRNNWTLIRYPDRIALPKALCLMPEIDLCHYDSDKSYQGRMWAYPILWQALKKGGMFISDDISDNYGFHDFCQSLNRTPFIVDTGQKYVGILIKD